MLRVFAYVSPTHCVIVAEVCSFAAIRLKRRHGNCIDPFDEIVPFTFDHVELRSCRYRQGRMTLADFTAPELVLPDLRNVGMEAVLLELSQLLQSAGRVPDAKSLYEAALKRERLVSTAMTAGMAFPHARLPEVKELSFALGRSANSFAWSANSNRQVRLVFLIAVSPNDAMQYLQLISGISRLSSQPDRVQQLLVAKTPESLLNVLRQVTVWTKPPFKQTAP